MINVAALYKFTSLVDVNDLRKKLMDLFQACGIKGTIILAHEGINGTVAGTRDAIDQLKHFLHTDGRFDGMEYKEAETGAMPFKRIKIHVKKEIVTLGRPDINPVDRVGTYVNVDEWNDLLRDPNVTVLDVRNDFEVKLGSFQGAINPQTKTFGEFTDFVKNNLTPAAHKKIAMSCTGGIRCEKASALLKHMGFDEVFHLKGGVLRYLEDVPKDKSLWQGQCFVFDDRVTVDHDTYQRSPSPAREKTDEAS